MCEKQNKPHVHAELIKAWADGAIIEFRNSRSKSNDWEVVGSPSWYPEYEYRVKPPKKSPGQIAEETFYKAWGTTSSWEDLNYKEKRCWEAVAQAVIDSLNQK